MILESGALAGGGIAALVSWGLFHPRARLFGPVIWRGPRDQPRVALTFDDGPHPAFTPRIAEALEKRGLKATFFCVGQRVERHPDVARELVRAGHELENHTWRHDTGRDLFVTARLSEDLQRCQSALASISGRPPVWYRPAVGIRNPVVHAAARGQGLKVVTWTVAARDGAFALTPERARRLAHRCEAGSILALHDGTLAEKSALRERTVSSLGTLLEALAARGLQCVTLAELLG